MSNPEPSRLRTNQVKIKWIIPGKEEKSLAYNSNQDELPRLFSVVPGRERVFFASKELTDMVDYGI